MATPPPDPDVTQLLADLRNEIANRRYAAVQALAAAKVDTPEVVAALTQIAGTDPSDRVRKAALDALSVMAPTIGAPELEAARAAANKLPTYLSRSEKTAWFFAGFVAWFVVNGVLGGLCTWLAMPGNAAANTASAVISSLLLLANPAALIVLAFFPRGRWAALGALAAMGVALCLVLVAALLFTAWCFMSYGSGGGL